jgi:preprotein translocase subunit YajC
MDVRVSGREFGRAGRRAPIVRMGPGSSSGLAAGLGLCVPALLWAQAPGPGLGGPSFLIQLVPFLLIFVIFYFLLIRPQAKRQREHAAMLSGLKKGDEVLTQGGIFGVVVGTRDDVVVLKIAEETKVEVAKHAISALRGKSTNG